jgi:hypothetical protein
MTEAEWLGGQNPYLLLTYLAQSAGSGNVVSHVSEPKQARKLRLFAVCCGRLIHNRMPNAAGRAAIELAERFADGRVSAAELKSSHRAVWKVWHTMREDSHSTALWTAAWVTDSRNAQAACQSASGFEVVVGKTDASSVLLCALVRDIFSNPFRPVTFTPEWRTDTAIALARQIYESREFAVMPILADALQDAGCDNADILSHCRGDGPHIRGCWVVDLVLGKE